MAQTGAGLNLGERREQHVVSPMLVLAIGTMIGRVMNLHRLAEERSLELHRAVVTRLRQEPGLVELAQTRIEERREKGF